MLFNPGAFSVLLLSMPPISLVDATLQSHMKAPVSFSNLAPTHHLFIRKHASKDSKDTLPTDRTLFLVNIPIDTTPGHLARLFRHCGIMESIVFNEDSVIGVVSGASCHVVFKDTESVDSILEMKQRKRVWTASESSGTFTIKDGKKIWTADGKFYLIKTPLPKRSKLESTVLAI